MGLTLICYFIAAGLWNTGKWFANRSQRKNKAFKSSPACSTCGFYSVKRRPGGIRRDFMKHLDQCEDRAADWQEDEK